MSATTAVTATRCRGRWSNRGRQDRYRADPLISTRANLMRIDPRKRHMFGRLRTFRFLGAEVRGELANNNFARHQSGHPARHPLRTSGHHQQATSSALRRRSSTTATKGLALFDRRLRPMPCRPSCRPRSTSPSDFNVAAWRSPRVVSTSAAERTLPLRRGRRRTRLLATTRQPTRPYEYHEDRGELWSFNPILHRDESTRPKMLPGIAFAYTGLYRSRSTAVTIAASPHVLRRKPATPDELGDNFQVGWRSSSSKASTSKLPASTAGCQDFQYGESGIAVGGDL